MYGMEMVSYIQTSSLFNFLRCQVVLLILLSVTACRDGDVVCIISSLVKITFGLSVGFVQADMSNTDKINDRILG